MTASRSVPTCVLVAVTDEERRGRSEDVAAALRSRGISTEVAPKADKFGKQIRYADRRGIPFVWFPDTDDGHAVKDIRSGRPGRRPIPPTWCPPQQTSPPSVRLTSPDNEEIHP